MSGDDRANITEDSIGIILFFCGHNFNCKKPNEFNETGHVHDNLYNLSIQSMYYDQQCSSGSAVKGPKENGLTQITSAITQGSIATKGQDNVIIRSQGNKDLPIFNGKLTIGLYSLENSKVPDGRFRKHDTSSKISERHVYEYSTPPHSKR